LGFSPSRVAFEGAQLQLRRSAFLNILLFVILSEAKNLLLDAASCDSIVSASAAEASALAPFVGGSTTL
jgi:hypothetical protein